MSDTLHPKRTYRYEVIGNDRDGHGFTITGYVDDLPGELFHHVIQVIEAEVFMQLTQGKAVYGHPETTCKGPYRLLKVTIEDKPEFEEVSDIQF